MEKINKIIDIHSHILPGVDDGPKHVEKSIDILKTLEKIGFESIILTSHYIENTKFNIDIKKRKEIINNLQNKTNINLYLGNEVFVCDNIIELQENKFIATLNNSRYMLIEFPFNDFNNKNFVILSDLLEKGFIPVIAHPERYLFLQEDKELINELKDIGCLFQCNAGSISGKYGKNAKKLIKYLLKNNYVDFISSDIHSLNGIDKIIKGYKKLFRILKKEKFEKLTYTNPKKIINNEKI